MQKFKVVMTLQNFFETHFMTMQKKNNPRNPDLINKYYKNDKIKVWTYKL